MKRLLFINQCVIRHAGSPDSPAVATFNYQPPVQAVLTQSRVQEKRLEVARGTIQVIYVGGDITFAVPVDTLHLQEFVPSGRWGHLGNWQFLVQLRAEDAFVELDNVRFDLMQSVLFGKTRRQDIRRASDSLDLTR